MLLEKSEKMGEPQDSHSPPSKCKLKSQGKPLENDVFLSWKLGFTYPCSWDGLGYGMDSKKILAFSTSQQIIRWTWNQLCWILLIM
jgi:hypothetical protein